MLFLQEIRLTFIIQWALVLNNLFKSKIVQKILVTLGPSSLTKEVVQECDKSGVYLYRVNLSHTDLEDVAEIIRKIKNWTETPICLDSEGAQLRNQKMRCEPTRLIKGEYVDVHFDEVLGDSKNISLRKVHNRVLWHLIFRCRAPKIICTKKSEARLGRGGEWRGGVRRDEKLTLAPL